jgi:hypothetical protein
MYCVHLSLGVTLHVQADTYALCQVVGQLLEKFRLFRLHQRYNLLNNDGFFDFTAVAGPCTQPGPSSDSLMPVAYLVRKGTQYQPSQRFHPRQVLAFLQQLAAEERDSVRAGLKAEQKSIATRHLSLQHCWRCT